LVRVIVRRRDGVVNVRLWAELDHPSGTRRTGRPDPVAIMFDALFVQRFSF
jgi:hypothetical protein